LRRDGPPPGSSDAEDGIERKNAKSEGPDAEERIALRRGKRSPPTQSKPARRGKEEPY